MKIITNLLDKLLLKGRSVYLRVSEKELPPRVTCAMAEYEGQQASSLIKDKLMSGKPCMIARFGEVELDFLTDYRTSNAGFSKYLKYVTGEIEAYKVPSIRYRNACRNAGIFPPDGHTLSKFYHQMLDDMAEVDVLGSWLQKERFFEKEIAGVTKIGLADLDPWVHEIPWSLALSGRKVLVIHPFAETIRSQYLKRSQLFENRNILPDFELQTIKAVQTIGGENKAKYQDWFQALEQMKSQIDQTDFDIAILGCGAYGFPLAAHVKRIGKQSVHMGGSTQILFGIKGQRWEQNVNTAALMNEYWVRPSKEETPQTYSAVEGGCYW